MFNLVTWCSHTTRHATLRILGNIKLYRTSYLTPKGLPNKDDDICFIFQTRAQRAVSFTQCVFHRTKLDIELMTLSQYGSSTPCYCSCR